MTREQGPCVYSTKIWQWSDYHFVCSLFPMSCWKVMEHNSIKTNKDDVTKRNDGFVDMINILSFSSHISVCIEHRAQGIVKWKVWSWNRDWQLIQKGGYPILHQSQRQPLQTCCVQMSKALLNEKVIKNWIKELFSADGGVGGREWWGIESGRKSCQKWERVCMWESKSEQQFTHHLFCTDYN